MVAPALRLVRDKQNSQTKKFVTNSNTEAQISGFLFVKMTNNQRLFLDLLLLVRIDPTADRFHPR